MSLNNVKERREWLPSLLTQELMLVDIQVELEFSLHFSWVYQPN